MNDTDIRRHLTGVRALVLDLIYAHSPATKPELVDAWAARRPELSAVRQARLPRMLEDTLWRLVSLGWVRRQGDTYTLTDEGERVRAAAPFS